MKIKRMVKRLAAVGAGAVMLGATAMGALATDLSDYPEPMVASDGTFNGVIVVGEKAAGVDTLGAIDIATSMKTRQSGTSTVTVEGDNWQVGTSAEWLEINESIGPSGTSGVVDYIDDNDLGALADGTFSNSKGSFDYEQKLHFENPGDGAGSKAWFQENEDDVVDVFWKFTDGDQIAKYELDFITDAESDIDASDSMKLKDYEDKKINMLGKEWTITIAKHGGVGSGQVELTFMGGATTGTLLEGDSATFNVQGNEYEVAVTYVDADEVAFTVDGESTGKLEDGETYSASAGVDIGVSDILYQEYAGGVHQASFFLGANKLYVKDEAINDTSYSSTDVKVNEETIDGMTPLVVGTIVTEPTATVDGELKLDYMHINMTAQDDMYLSPGDKLSENADLDEAEILFTSNWDFEYHGFEDSDKVHDIQLAKNGDDKYELNFDSNDGNRVSLPLMYAESSAIYTGKKSGDNLALDPATNITDDDYFILNSKDAATGGNDDAVTTVLQYVSSKNSGDSVQTIKFKNLNTGDTFERTFDDSCTFDISLNGRTHNFQNVSVCTANNFDIALTSTDFTADSTLGGNVSTLALRDASGALILVANGVGEANHAAQNALVDDPSTAITNSNLTLTINIDDSDRDDDLYSVANGARTELAYRLTYTDTNEVTATRTVNPAWSVSDPDDTDVTWGYTEYGSMMKHVAASSTPVEFTLTVPETARKVLAYITTGASTSTVSLGGDYKAVVVVDASKLDSEIASVTAQNVIAVGGPCVNTVAAELLGSGADCAEGFSPGKARVKWWEHANGNVAMLVAGYSGADTRLAAKVVAHRWTEFSGDEVEVEGTTYTDASIGAPSVAVVADEPAEEEEMADEEGGDAEDAEQTEE